MTWLERHWQRVTFVSALLYPLSLIFRGIVALRRAAYRTKVLASRRLGVPVIVVGNITVGGTGKTPLVLWLAEFLLRRGFHPGIVSRGYGSSQRSPRRVTAASDPARVGDEPVLLAQRSGCPVWVGTSRVAAGEALLRAHPECDVVVSDDGLQHYALQRDVEIAVVDGERGMGNGFMLPAGPLREPPSRLRSVDAIAVTGGAESFATGLRGHSIKLEGRDFRNLLNPDHVVGPAHFQRQRVHAIAGIGNPQRFFTHLEALGLRLEPHAFPDHYAYTPADVSFPNADAILMTEKDAVKCAAFAAETHWVLRVDALPDSELGELILRRLRS